MLKMTADEILYFKKALATAILHDTKLNVATLNDISRRLVQGLRTSERLEEELSIRKQTICTCEGCLSMIRLLKKLQDVPLPD